MSKTRIQLRLSESVKRKAKRIAKSRGISVSQLFEEIVIQEEKKEDLDLSTDK